MNIISRLGDPRYYQIAVLTTLLSIGVFVLDFGIHWENAIAIVLTAQAVQYLGTRLAGLPASTP